MDNSRQFHKRQFISIETYRKNGTGVQTPVWFYQDGTVLYCTTEAGSGKVKRIRANPVVRVAPCTVNGRPLGSWVPAQAELMDERQYAAINRLLLRKYGLQKRFIDLWEKARKQTMIPLAIHLNHEQDGIP